MKTSKIASEIKKIVRRKDLFIETNSLSSSFSDLIKKTELRTKRNYDITVPIESSHLYREYQVLFKNN